MAIVCVISAFCVWYRAYCFNTIGEKIAKLIKYDFVSSLINKDITFFDSQKTGEILSRIANDTQVIQYGLSINISMFISTMIFIIATIIILALISWKLTLVTLGGIFPVIIVGKFYGDRIKIISKKVQD